MSTAPIAQGPVDVNVRCWLPIDAAPKDGSMVLVNDTTPGWTEWVVAHWVDGEDWSGWAYNDETLTEINPLGPNPTHWLHVPPLPTHNKLRRI